MSAKSKLKKSLGELGVDLTPNSEFKSIITGISEKHTCMKCTEEVNKVALSADDDKRLILNYEISTLAYRHWILKHNKAQN